ncbi:MAG: hypothetical protein PHP52_01185, partial [Bacteroidales bacterium]|nr:hypothetical protein [Bacteroidales bacterium]
MKKLNLILIAVLFSSIAFSQWNITGTPLWDRYGKTNATVGQNIKAIGIGEFTYVPKAALHVNANLLDAPTNPITMFTPGQVFRTDGPSNQDNMWQLFTGPDATAIEKARFSVPANTNDLVIEACMGHSNICFNLVHDRQRAILTDGHGQGHFGVGDDFSDPQHMIHVHTSPTDIPTIPPSDIGFTNSNIGATENDGFIAGIEPDGTAFINQQEEKDILFSTGAGTNNHSRIVIKGEEGDNQGFVGIGTNYSNPLSVLHIDANNMATGEIFRTNGPSTVFNSWRFFTGGTSGTEKFQIFTSTNLGTANGTLQNDQNITLQSTQRDMIFNAGGDGLNFERMRILGQDHDLSSNTPWFATARAGNVGIGTPHPLCMLQIGGEAAAGGGWRDWMNIGTYYASEAGYDNMYVGLRRRDITQSDRNEAIINWGNNPTTETSFDRLRFVFTANAFVGLPASEEDGLEIARMISDGNSGFMGIGDFFTIDEDPTQVLDVIGNARIREVPYGELDSALVIDGNGVLYWRNFAGGGPGTTLGNVCDDVENPLEDNWEIPLDNYNFVF